LSDFEVRDPLGSGAMGAVFEAVHKRTGELVALKRLDGASRDSLELRERLAREALLLASVHSPHVARLLGHGWDDGQPFVVLERLRGETLADLLRREGRLGVARLVDWTEQLLIGVRDCHRANIIHRDIKPANIFLAAPEEGTGEPIVKLIDLGVARLDATGTSSLTSTRHLIGSVAYMAPEQLESPRDVGPAADVYALGVVLFRCVTGRLPFGGNGVEELIRSKFKGTPPRLSSVPGVEPSEPLEAFVAQALSCAQEDRFPNAGEMLEQWWRVAAALEREPPPSGVDVTFDDDEWVNTLVESLAQTDAAPLSNQTLRTAILRQLDEEPTHAEAQAPSAASREDENGDGS
jgi:serine/threonine-protein kinase